MDYFEHSRVHYFHEAERRFKMNSSLSFPVGLVAIFTGAGYNLMAQIGRPLDWLDWLSYFFLALFATSIAISVYHLVHSHWSIKYKYVASPLDVICYRDELEEYYKKTPNSKANVDTKLKDWLRSSYDECTKLNTTNNDFKAAHLHKANTFIVASFVILILATLPNLLGLAWHDSGPLLIEIINSDSK